MIPFVDLQAQYARIRSEVEPAVLAVLASGQYVQGAEVAAFEQEFAAYSDARHAVAVNTGTSALHLALLAAGVGPGDEVVTVPHTFAATVAAILYAGARPVFIDIDPATYTLDPTQLEAAIGPRTRAIIPVHLYGQPADLDPILAVARRHGLVVIEDAAQAHGAEDKGRRIGGIGDLTCFSFYPGKNLGACGEGGALTTNDDELARKARLLRSWGEEKKYEHRLQGFNYRLDEIQGAILRIKLRHLEEWTEARRAHAARYDWALADLPLATPVARHDVRHVYHVYAVRTAGAVQREALRQALAADGIATNIHYPIPVHLQEAYADLGYGPGAFPHAERAAGEVLSLPMYAELPRNAAERVATGIRRALGQASQVSVGAA